MRYFSLALLAIASLTITTTVSANTAYDQLPHTRNLSPQLTRLLERADRDAFHEDPQWLALVHYEKNRFSKGVFSPAITRSFFLAEHGDKDPRAELHATLLNIFTPTPVTEGEDHPQCAFIARRYWLEQKFGQLSQSFPQSTCTKYENWRTQLDAKGLTLVFPEGFISNPASIFGHTLLRVDTSPTSGQNEILGYAIDFTANTGDDGGISYVAKGVTGSYPAFFNLRPYYQQLKNYADWENRDIWEYRLNVDQAQVDFLLMHLWELSDIEFPYYFFTKNCSYELLRLLEIGIAGFEASTHFQGLVFPVDTVRFIANKPQFVSSTRYRASPETKLRAGLTKLSNDDSSHVQAIVKGRLAPTDQILQQIPPPRRAKILDLAYEQLRYDYLARNISDVDSRGLSRRILIARSRISGFASEGNAPVIDYVVPSIRPDQGHDTSLVELSAGWRDNESFVDFRLRLAFHSFMDNSGGYPEFMEVRVLDTNLRIFPESGRVRLQELTFLEIDSLSPRSYAFKPWALSMGTGLRTRRVHDDGNLDDTLVWGTHFGAGLAWDPHPAILLYGLPNMRLDVGSDLENDFSFGPGARLGVFAGKHESHWKGHLFGEYTQFMLGDSTTSLRGGAELRLTTSRNTALTFEGSANRIHGENWFEGALRVSLYF